MLPRTLHDARTQSPEQPSRMPGNIAIADEIVQRTPITAAASPLTRRGADVTALAQRGSPRPSAPLTPASDTNEPEHYRSDLDAFETFVHMRCPWTLVRHLLTSSSIVSL